MSDVNRLVNRDMGSISFSVRRLTDRKQGDPGLRKRIYDSVTTNQTFLIQGIGNPQQF